jgi:hypothetical protein
VLVMARVTPSEHLLARLRELGLEIPERAWIRRTYVGRNQRRDGAWCWTVLAEDGRSLNIGSQWPVTDLVRGEIEIDRQHDTRDWHVYPSRS